MIGIDQDHRAIEAARERLARFGDSVRLVLGRFSAIEEHLAAFGAPKVDGIVADLGVSSPQLTDPVRGMSFRSEGPLDMRMGDSDETALELIERLSTDELADLIYQFGEERRSRRIARCIQQAVRHGAAHDSRFTARGGAGGRSRAGGRVDPATRTFQALRIAVNHELDELTALLDVAPRVLGPGAVLAVISFHSLEDRLVKRAFLQREVWERLTTKPVVPSRGETEQNPRSRSAKLRAARKVAS